MVNADTLTFYDARCHEDGPPREGYYRIPISRWERYQRHLKDAHRRQYKAARIYRPVPIDPETGEVLDRWPMVEAELEGNPVDYRFVWAFGDPISKEEYEWLRALNAIRLT